MVTYSCKRCGYTTNQISNMKVHLYNRVTICSSLQETNVPDDWINLSLQKEYIGMDNVPKIHHCFFCNKIFSSSYNLSRHKKTQKCLEKNEIIINDGYIPRKN